MEFRPLCIGFAFLEAPRADEAGNLFFSDVVLGGIHKRSPDGRTSTLMAGRRWIGGIALNEDGALICSGRGGLRYAHQRRGGEGTLLDRIDGKPIIAINDIQPDGQGGLYFGTMDGEALERGRNPVPSALYRLDPDGRLTLLRDDMKISNGIGLSPDGRRLYHNETWVGTWAYDLSADRRIQSRTLLIEQPDCDGLAVDAEGGIWLAACRSGTLTRLLPDGTVDRCVTLPVKEVTSLCFGGADARDVYVTCAYPGAIDLASTGAVPRTGGVFHARSEVPGLPMPRTRFTLPKK